MKHTLFKWMIALVMAVSTGMAPVMAEGTPDGGGDGNAPETTDSNGSNIPSLSIPDGLGWDENGLPQWNAVNGAEQYWMHYRVYRNETDTEVLTESTYTDLNVRDLGDMNPVKYTDFPQALARLVASKDSTVKDVFVDFNVTAFGDGKNYLDSEASGYSERREFNLEGITVDKIPAPTITGFSDDLVLSYTKVEGAQQYIYWVYVLDENNNPIIADAQFASAGYKDPNHTEEDLKPIIDKYLQDHNLSGRTVYLRPEVFANGGDNNYSEHAVGPVKEYTFKEASEALSAPTDVNFSRNGVLSWNGSKDNADISEVESQIWWVPSGEEWSEDSEHDVGGFYKDEYLNTQSINERVKLYNIAKMNQVLNKNYDIVLRMRFDSKDLTKYQNSPWTEPIRITGFLNVTTDPASAVKDAEDAETVNGTGRQVIVAAQNDGALAVEKPDEAKEAIKEAYEAGKEITAGIQVDKEQNAEKPAEAGTEETVLESFDVKAQLKSEGTVLANMTQLSSAINVPLSVENAPAVPEGLKRTYTVYRTHDGTTEKVDSALSEDEKTLNVTTDKFSTYTVTYEDKEPVLHTVIFDPANGDNKWTQTFEDGEALSLPENAPAYDGHTFKGWSENGTDVLTTLPQVTQDMTLTAIWEQVFHTVTFNPANGNGQWYQQFAEGTNLTLPENPVYYGYTFKGWSVNGKDVLSELPKVTQDMTLTAIWEKIVHTVTFDPANGEKVITKTFGVGESLNVPDKPVYSGYKFKGWSENGKDILSVYPIVDRDMSFTALWEKEWPCYDLKLDSDGYASWYERDGSLDDYEIKASLYEEGENTPFTTVSLPVTENWRTSVNGAIDGATKATHKPGDKIKVSYHLEKNGENLSLESDKFDYTIVSTVAGKVHLEAPKNLRFTEDGNLAWDPIPHMSQVSDFICGFTIYRDAEDEGENSLIGGGAVSYADNEGKRMFGDKSFQDRLNKVVTEFVEDDIDYVYVKYCVKAMSGGDFISSDYSDYSPKKKFSVSKVEKLETPIITSFEDGILSWKPVEHAWYYSITIRADEDTGVGTFASTPLGDAKVSSLDVSKTLAQYYDDKGFTGKKIHLLFNIYALADPKEPYIESDHNYYDAGEIQVPAVEKKLKTPENVTLTKDFKLHWNKDQYSQSDLDEISSLQWSYIYVPSGDSPEHFLSMSTIPGPIAQGNEITTGTADVSMDVFWSVGNGNFLDQNFDIIVQMRAASKDPSKISSSDLSEPFRVNNFLSVETDAVSAVQEKKDADVVNTTARKAVFSAGTASDADISDENKAIKTAYQNGADFTAGINVAADQKVEKPAEAAENEKVLGSYDVTAQLKANNVVVATMPQLDSAIEVPLPIPEAEAPAAGYSRDYSVYRTHGSETEKLDGVTVSDDGKTLNVTTDKFSVYTITYEDVKDTSLHAVTIDLNDGSTPVVQLVRDGKDAVLPADPVRKGYVFKGWDSDGKNITEDTTITAEWKEVTSEFITTPEEKEAGVEASGSSLVVPVEGNIITDDALKQAIAEGTISESDSIERQSYLDVKKDKTSENSLVYTIVPKYRDVAVAADGSVKKIFNEGKIEELTKADASTPDLKMTLSVAGIEAAEGTTVYVIHTKTADLEFVYAETVAADQTVTFANPHGFSTFTITKENPVKAMIGSDMYTSLKGAVSRVKDGETIVIPDGVDAGSTAVDRAVSFTLKLGEGSKAEITASSGYALTTNGDVYTVTAVAKQTASKPEQKSGEWHGDNVTLMPAGQDGYDADGRHLTSLGNGTVYDDNYVVWDGYRHKLGRYDPASGRVVALTDSATSSSTTTNKSLIPNTADHFHLFRWAAALVVSGLAAVFAMHELRKR